MAKTQDELISIGMAALARKRWENTTDAKKAAHIRKMNKARLAKKRRN